MRSIMRRLASLAFAAAGCASEAPSASITPFEATDASETAPSDVTDPDLPEPSTILGSLSGEERSLQESPSLSRVLELTDPDAAPDGVAVTSRARRLTHAEYVRTVGTLLGIDARDAIAEFPAELPTLDGYFALGSLGMNERLVDELRASAEILAERFVADPNAYASLVSCNSASAGCRDEFIATFGRRAYRRPLTGSESERFRALFDGAAELASSGDAFRDGVRLVVEAALQSPNFLYRIERGSGMTDEQGERIDGYGAATRLSYLILGRGPDERLLDAAEAGELSTTDGIVRMASELVMDPGARERVTDFHARWLALDALPGASKDVEVFPEHSPELLTSMRAEVERYVEEVTLNDDGALITLFTAPYGFVDARLAAVYDLPGTFGDELERVQFAADSPRGGLLTQAGFLAGHSSSNSGTSPILRGVFVLRRLLCQAIPDPPPNAQSTEPPPSEQPLVTTRDYFTWKTSMAACRGCHSQINPVGFAFEDFDGIGRHRNAESGEPIDASGLLQLGGRTLEFDGGKDVGRVLSELPEAQACYARNWLRYAWGRADTEADLETLTRLRLGLSNPAYGVRDILIDIAESTAFSHISAAE